MKIEDRKLGAVLVTRPDGPIAGGDASVLHAHLSTAIVAQAGRLVVDASAVPFVDSAGLEVLVELGEQVANAGRCLKLAGLNETVREVFELTEVADLFEYYETPGAAARSFA